MVNVLEVPTEAEPFHENPPNPANTSIESTVFTLDPRQKYRALRPLGCKLALTKPDVTSPQTSSGQIHTQVSLSERQRSDHENKISSHFYQVPSDLSGMKGGGWSTSSGLFSGGSTLMTIFHRSRGTRSAGCSRGRQETHSQPNSGGEPSELVPKQPVPLERTMQKVHGKSSVPARHVSLAKPTDLMARTQALKPRFAATIGAKIGTEYYHAQDCQVLVKPEVPPKTSLGYDCQITPLCTSFEQRGFQCAGQLASSKVLVPFHEAHDASNSQTLDLLNDDFCQLLNGQGSRLPNSSNAVTGKASVTNRYVKQCSATEPPNDVFSTSLGYSLPSNGSSSPIDLSEVDLQLSSCDEHRRKLFNYEQHDDVTITDEENARTGPHGPTQAADNLPTAAARGELFSSGCFSEHNLRSFEQTSAMTAKLSQKTPYLSQYSASTLLNHNARANRILLWSGESKHHLTATEELVDDLGYLGEVIT